jgi:hypothetical protein
MATLFDQMELIIDNLLNRDEEPEDAILAASAVLRRLVAQARQESSSPRMPTATAEEPGGGIPGEY